MRNDINKRIINEKIKINKNYFDFQQIMGRGGFGKVRKIHYFPYIFLLLELLHMN